MKASFTLVEALIAMAIISFLAALLLPAVQKGISKANEVATVSKMHQIHVGIMAYTADNDGTLPGPTVLAVYSVARVTPLDGDGPALGMYIGKYLGAVDTNSGKLSAYYCPALACPALSSAVQHNAIANAMVPNWRAWDNYVASSSPSDPNAADNIFGIFGGATMATARVATPRPKKLASVSAVGQRTPILSTADQGTYPSGSTTQFLPKSGVFDGQRLWLFLDGSIVKSTNNAQVFP